MKIVETLKKTYLTMDVEEMELVTSLKKAVVVDVNATDDEVARAYVRGTLTGKVIDIKVKNQNIESIQDAEEVGPLVDLMLKYLPLAEKNAKATAILSELEKLMGGDSSNDDA